MREQRMADFHRRVEFAPQNVYRHPHHCWDYIPIHPFADEVDPCHWSESQFQAVDSWCAINGDATLLQLSTAEWSDQEPGLYILATDGELSWTYLSGVVETEVITRGIFEDVMVRFSQLGFPDRDHFPTARSQSLQFLDHL